MVISNCWQWYFYGNKDSSLFYCHQIDDQYLHSFKKRIKASSHVKSTLKCVIDHYHCCIKLVSMQMISWIGILWTKLAGCQRMNWQSSQNYAKSRCKKTSYYSYQNVYYSKLSLQGLFLIWSSMTLIEVT